MTEDVEPDLSVLIAKCECAIRRGNVAHQETLHSFQQQLVTARDARYESDTEATLSAAIKFYYQHIPAEERTTTFAALTDQLAQIASDLEISDGDSQSTNPITQ